MYLPQGDDCTNCHLSVRALSLMKCVKSLFETYGTVLSSLALSIYCDYVADKSQLCGYLLLNFAWLTGAAELCTLVSTESCQVRPVTAAELL